MPPGRFSGCNRSIVFRYTLLQLPGLALVIIVLLLLEHWLDLPTWWKIVGALLWAGKDALLFPLTWRAYDPDSAHRSKSWKGKWGKIRHMGKDETWVEVGGELWKARGTNPATTRFAEGERVHIVKRQGMTLYIEKDKTLN